jgi:hypothetical protein
MDFASRKLSIMSDEITPFNARENEELSRRRSLWTYYLLRSPVYDKIAAFFAAITPSRLHGVGSYIQTYRDYHSYTSGSS